MCILSLLLPGIFQGICKLFFVWFCFFIFFFFFSSRRRHTRYWRDGVQTCALPISNAGGEVLLHLRRRERAVVDGDELDDALPLALTGGLVAQHQCEGAVPVGERAALGRIGIAAIDQIGRASCRERVEI